MENETENTGKLPFDMLRVYDSIFLDQVTEDELKRTAHLETPLKLFDCIKSLVRNYNGCELDRREVEKYCKGAMIACVRIHNSYSTLKAENEEKEKAIRYALNLQQLWMPSDNIKPEHEGEAQALSEMRTVLLNAITPNQ